MRSIVVIAIVFDRVRSFIDSVVCDIGVNHDISASSNWHHHFNTSTDFNARQTADNAKTAMEGTVYSFVWNDALFLVVNFEDFGKGEPYFAALENWMRAEVAAHPSTKWRITAFHRAMFTGSSSHQSEREGRVQGSKIVRDRFAGLFEELQIDLALQGHDHIYEVIGPVDADQRLVPNAVTNQRSVAVDAKMNVTGVEGGTFNVANGTLFTLLGRAGSKAYLPFSPVFMAEGRAVVTLMPSRRVVSESDGGCAAVWKYAPAFAPAEAKMRNKNRANM